MARLEARRWAGDLAGPTRSDRSPCAYEVYLPDRLTGRRFTLDGDVAADVSSAESALARLDASADALANSEALARLLLRAESVASSRIEGLEKCMQIIGESDDNGLVNCRGFGELGDAPEYDATIMADPYGDFSVSRWLWVF